MKFNGTFWQEKGSVPAGQSVIVVLARSHPFAVSLKPGATGSAAAQYTLADADAVAAGTAIWLDLVATTDDTAKGDASQVPVAAIKITATGQPCDYEVLQ